MSDERSIGPGTQRAPMRPELEAASDSEQSRIVSEWLDEQLDEAADRRHDEMSWQRSLRWRALPRNRSHDERDS